MVLLNSSLVWAEDSYEQGHYEAEKGLLSVYISLTWWYILFEGKELQKGKFTSPNMPADQRKRIAQLRFTSFLNSLI